VPDLEGPRVKISEDLAALRVRAALGRAPQDRLEATVVLESWGVSSDLAIAVAGPDRDAGPISGWQLAPEMDHASKGQEALEVIGLLAGIMAATICAGPIISRLGRSADDAWRVALPITLFVQWTLRRYHRSLSAPARRERLGGFRHPAWGAAVLAVACLTPTLLVVYPVAGASLSLVVLWTGGLLVTRRGWAPLYVALLVAGALAVSLRLRVAPVIGTESEAMLALVVVAVLSSCPSHQLPGSWLGALRSGCVGALLGCMIVTVALPGNAASVKLLGLAMAPSLLGSVVWFYFVAAFWGLLRPGLDISRDSDSLLATHRLSRLINLAGLTGYCVATVLMSFAALGIAAGLGISSPDPTTIFLGLGTIGLAGVLFAWLDVLGRPGVALCVECCALGGGLLIHTMSRGVLASHGELLSAALAVVLAEVVVFKLHGQPEWLAARMV